MAALAGGGPCAPVQLIAHWLSGGSGSFFVEIGGGWGFI